MSDRPDHPAAADDRPRFPRLVGEGENLHLELGDDARENARKLRHDVADRLAAIRWIATILEHTPQPGDREREEWAEMLHRNAREIVRMIVVVQDLPPQPPPPPDPAVVKRVG